MEKTKEAVIFNDEIYCGRHGKRIGRLTADGIELWCKAHGGHAVILTLEDIRRANG